MEAYSFQIKHNVKTQPSMGYFIDNAGIEKKHTLWNQTYLSLNLKLYPLPDCVTFESYLVIPVTSVSSLTQWRLSWDFNE